MGRETLLRGNWDGIAKEMAGLVYRGLSLSLAFTMAFICGVHAVGTDKCTPLPPVMS